MQLARFLNSVFKKDGFILVDANSKNYIIGTPKRDNPIKVKILNKNLHYKLLFHPDLYFGEEQLEVDIKGIDLKLEGEARPGHFSGVIRVLSIFFKLLKPSLSFFGEKDFQQVLVVEQLVDQHFSHIQLVRCPTSREPNGLARSSRNKHLSSEEFVKAGEIFQVFVVNAFYSCANTSQLL